MEQIIKEKIIEALQEVETNDFVVNDALLNFIRGVDCAKELETENAGHYLCETDEWDVEEQIALIKLHKNQDDLIDDVDGVMVWEPLERRFTCKDFLEMI